VRTWHAFNRVRGAAGRGAREGELRATRPAERFHGPHRKRPRAARRSAVPHAAGAVAGVLSLVKLHRLHWCSAYCVPPLQSPTSPAPTLPPQPLPADFLATLEENIKGAPRVSARRTAGRRALLRERAACRGSAPSLSCALLARSSWSCRREQRAARRSLQVSSLSTLRERPMDLQEACRGQVRCLVGGNGSARYLEGSAAVHRPLCLRLPPGPRLIVGGPVKEPSSGPTSPELSPPPAPAPPPAPMVDLLGGFDSLSIAQAPAAAPAPPPAAPPGQLPTRPFDPFSFGGAAAAPGLAPSFGAPATGPPTAGGAPQPGPPQAAPQPPAPAAVPAPYTYSAASSFANPVTAAIAAGVAPPVQQPAAAQFGATSAFGHGPQAVPQQAMQAAPPAQPAAAPPAPLPTQAPFQPFANPTPHAPVAQYMPAPTPQAAPQAPPAYMQAPPTAYGAPSYAQPPAPAAAPAYPPYGAGATGAAANPFGSPGAPPANPFGSPGTANPQPGAPPPAYGSPGGGASASVSPANPFAGPTGAYAAPTNPFAVPGGGVWPGTAAAPVVVSQQVRRGGGYAVAGLLSSPCPERRGTYKRSCGIYVTRMRAAPLPHRWAATTSRSQLTP
jgi:hypothetical protein